MSVRHSIYPLILFLIAGNSLHANVGVLIFKLLNKPEPTEDDFGN